MLLTSSVASKAFLQLLLMLLQEVMLILDDVVMGTFGWDDVSVGYLAVGAAAPKAVAVRSTAVFMLSCN